MAFSEGYNKQNGQKWPVLDTKFKMPQANKNDSRTMLKWFHATRKVEIHRSKTKQKRTLGSLT